MVLFVECCGQLDGLAEGVCMSALTVRSEETFPAKVIEGMSTRSRAKQDSCGQLRLKGSNLFVLPPRATERTGEKR
jgi:hypothetical protein